MASISVEVSKRRRITEIVKEELELPPWFNDKPGFKFCDPDGNPCIVLGRGRKEKRAEEETIMFAEYSMSRRTWYLWGMDIRSDVLGQGSRPFWTPEQEEQISGDADSL